MENWKYPVITKGFTFRNVCKKSDLPSVDDLEVGDLVYASDTAEIYAKLGGDAELVQICSELDTMSNPVSEPEVQHRCEYCGTLYTIGETHCKSCGAPL